MQPLWQWSDIKTTDNLRIPTDKVVGSSDGVNVTSQVQVELQNIDQNGSAIDDIIPTSSIGMT